MELIYKIKHSSLNIAFCPPGSRVLSSPASHNLYCSALCRFLSHLHPCYTNYCILYYIIHILYNACTLYFHFIWRVDALHLKAVATSPLIVIIDIDMHFYIISVCFLLCIQTITGELSPLLLFYFWLNKQNTSTSTSYFCTTTEWVGEVKIQTK